MKLISSISALTAGLIFQGEQSVAEASNVATGLGPVALLGIASSMAVLKHASANAPPCIEKDVDYLGYDMLSVKDRSAADCSKRCRHTDGCKYWTYDPDHLCWLKTSSAGRTSRPNTASGDLSCPWHRCLTEGVQLFGEKLRSLTVGTAKECQEACESEPECVAFTRPVIDDGSACSLMKDSRNQTSKSFGYISGMSNCEIVDCAIAGHTLEGTPLQDPIEAESLAHCADGCKQTHFCTAGTYTPSTKQCVLYDVFKPVAKPGTNAFNLLDCDSSTCAGIGMAFEGSDFTNVPAISAMDCQQKCKEDERCHAYSFHIPAKQCYMKPKAKAPKFVPDHVSGLADCDNFSSTPCIEDRKDYVETDVGELKTDNVAQCAAKCREHEECILFTFNKTSGDCYLKRPGAVKVEYSLEGVRGDVTCASDPCVEVGTRYSGTAIGGDWPAENPKECQRLCKKNWECNFYTFSYPNTCKLMKDKGSVHHNSFSEVSGPRFCY